MAVLKKLLLVNHLRHAILAPCATRFWLVAEFSWESLPNYRGWGFHYPGRL